MNPVGERMLGSGQVSIERNGRKFAADFKVNGGSITVVYCCGESGLIRGTTAQLGAFCHDPEHLATTLLTQIVADLVARQTMI
jgi:hypothetical protein